MADGAVDPELVDQAERSLLRTSGVLGVRAPRMRWIGHRIRGEVALDIDGGDPRLPAQRQEVAAH